MKQKIIKGYRLNLKEALEILRTYSDTELFQLANDLREHYLGRKMTTCMIMNAKSGKCSENCKWCSQSIHHQTDVEVYDFIDEKEVLDRAKLASEKGVTMFSLVTSGRKLSSLNLSRVSKAYQNVRKAVPQIRYCASMGLLSKKDLQELYDAGVRRYHCNIETAPSFFSSLCTTHTLDDKLNTLKWAREVGMELCSGGIIGMGETMEQRVEMALFLQKMNIYSIPMNILIPIPGTPLESLPSLEDDEILRTFAIFRILNPEADIRFAGGRIRIQHIQDKALRCGISASMVGDLLTTAGLNIDDDIQHFKSLNYEL